MAKETQKAKIERLESELVQAHRTIAEQNGHISKMQVAADNSFVNSPYKKQLEDKIKRLEMALQVAERSKEHAENKAKARDEHLQELQKQVEQLKASTNIHKLKNERGAGRKPKLTEAEIQSIKMYRLQGLSYKAIAKMFDCSVGTVYNVCATNGINTRL